MDTTFIYFLKDPENPMKGYVGKTDRPRKRLSDHYTECHDKKHRRANWLKALATRKLKPTLEVVDEVPFEHWPQLEVAYIEFFLEQGYELVNGTPGGEGVSFSGKKHTKEWCAAMTGEKNPCFGRTGEKSPMFGMSGDKHPSFGKKLPKSSSSFHGVCRYRITNKWKAQIHIAGKRKHLGYFLDEITAAKAYDSAARIYHDGFAKLNFPD